MAKFNSALLWRKLSALYLFFVVLFVFFGLFYFKYVPGNKQELNARGHRVLTQLTSNFQKRDQSLHNIFDAVTDHDFENLAKKENAYERLNENVPFDVRPYAREDSGKTNPFYPLQKGLNEDWSILYRGKADEKSYTVKVGLNGFTGPVLSARDDIFDTYFLLVDTGRQGNRKSNLLQVVCRKNQVTLSDALSADTLLAMQKNTDLSGICQLQIGSVPYEVFWVSFDFHNQHMILTGLISEEEYTQLVQSTPVNFLPTSIILISLILISLPFLKIYLLSPKESINSTDVFGTAVSFYLGASAICIIVFYSFFAYVSDLGWKNRLEKFSNTISKDISSELELAGRQLDHYDSLQIPHALQAKMTRSGNEGTAEDSVNGLLAPGIYQNIARLSWNDSNGETIAKWNPFDYEAPFTNLSGYDFFQLLQQKPADLSPRAGSAWPVVYPGKSNLTDEFYTFIAKYSQKRFDADSLKKKQIYPPLKAYCIGVAAILHCSVQPVIPKEFGFCLIDDAGEVLIDANANHNLQENLFEESGNAEGLSSIIRLKNPAIYFNLNLYGEPCVGRSVPIGHQPMFLVCYYKQKILARNVFRFLHFSVGSLACIYILAILCLLAATFSVWRPAQLLFNPDKKEWIRPSSTNNPNSYIHAYTLAWFTFMTALSILFSTMIQVFSTSLNNLFYIAVLTPLYGIWGFILSRKGSARHRVDPIGHRKATEIMEERLSPFLAIFRDGPSPALGLVLANFIILNLVRVTSSHPQSFLILVIFQALAISFLAWCHGRKLQDWKEANLRAKRNYKYSMYLSILLLGVLPTIGVLTYGFYAEKIQFKKNKLLKLGDGFMQRANYLETDLLPNYKSKVCRALGAEYRDSLVFRCSIYLYDRDTIVELKPTPGPELPIPGPKPRPMPDALYSFLMDKVYLSSPVWGDDVSIQDTAGDNSWRFDVPPPLPETKAQIRYRPAGTVNKAGSRIFLESNLQKPMADLVRLPVFVIVLFLALVAAMCYLGKMLIDGMIFRLFLEDLSGSDKIDQFPDVLLIHLNEKAPQPGYLKGFHIPNPLDLSFFVREKSFNDWRKGRPACTQQEFILAMTDALGPVYEIIWKDLSPEEQYVLFDFCLDRYTNYKNTGPICKLISKGILSRDEGVLNLFSLSFRQYVLAKKESPEILELKRKFSVAGNWENIRTPILSLIAVVAIFVVKTQADFTNNLIALLTTATTLLPLVLKMFNTVAMPGDNDKPDDKKMVKA